MKYLFTLLVLISTYTFGCSCAFSFINDSFQESDAVFIGKVIAIDSAKYDFSSNPVYAYTFEIEKDFKRKWEDSKSKKYTTIYTPLSNMLGGCGSSFTLNESYIVYGYSDEYSTATNMCTRTFRLDLVEKEEIDSLQILEKNYFNKKKNLLGVDYYGAYLDNNNELLIQFENEILKLKSVHKIYIILICSLALILIISLFFNFRKRK